MTGHIKAESGQSERKIVRRESYVVWGMTLGPYLGQTTAHYKAESSQSEQTIVRRENYVV